VPGYHYTDTRTVFARLGATVLIGRGMYSVLNIYVNREVPHLEWWKQLKFAFLDNARTDDLGRILLRNVVHYLPINMTSHPRRLESLLSVAAGTLNLEKVLHFK